MVILEPSPPTNQNQSLNHSLSLSLGKTKKKKTKIRGKIKRGFSSSSALLKTPYVVQPPPYNRRDFPLNISPSRTDSLPLLKPPSSLHLFTLNPPEKTPYSPNHHQSHGIVTYHRRNNFPHFLRHNNHLRRLPPLPSNPPSIHDRTTTQPNCSTPSSISL